MVKRLRHQTLGFERHILRMHHRLGAHHWLGHALKQVVFAVAEGVVHDRPPRLHAHARGTDQVEHGKMLGVGAGNPVERAQFPHPVGGGDGSEAFDSRISVGGVGCVQLIAAANPTHLGIFEDGIADGKGKVPGNPEDIGDADRTQAGEHVLNDGHWHGKSGAS